MFIFLQIMNPRTEPPFRISKGISEIQPSHQVSQYVKEVHCAPTLTIIPPVSGHYLSKI
jgi:hypothetical protein